MHSHADNIQICKDIVINNEPSFAAPNVILDKHIFVESGNPKASPTRRSQWDAEKGLQFHIIDYIGTITRSNTVLKSLTISWDHLISNLFSGMSDHVK